MQENNGIQWVVIQTAPHSKSNFFQTILNKKFTDHKFEYLRFNAIETQNNFNELKPYGIIAELKLITAEALCPLEKFLEKFQNLASVLILSPASFQLINTHKKAIIEKSTILLSEPKSVDYLLQLPRVIEELGRKQILKAQNEKLQKLIDSKISWQNHSDPLNHYEPSEELIGEVLHSLDSSPQKSGIRVHLPDWKNLKEILSHTALNEITDTLSRIINKAIRNSDQVLRAHENEFIIFLQQADQTIVNKCHDRLQTALNSFRISANSENLDFQVAITQLEASKSHF